MPIFTFRKIFRYFLLGLAVVLLLVAWLYGDLIVYGLGQAKGQWAVMRGAVPKEEFLAKVGLDPQVARKLLLIEEIKKFGTEELGLAPTNSYEKVYDQGGKPLIWNLTACPPYELNAYQWEFPFLGSFGYKGFFDKEKAEQEAQALQAQGLETYIYPVSAWSTLGILDDPVLSNMLYKQEGALANTILHEMTHGTLFIGDDLTFNENFATLVGDLGAELFLKKKFGDTSTVYLQYKHNMEDYRLYANHILGGAKELQALYGSFGDSTPAEEKEARKKALIGHIVARLDTVGFFLPELYLNHFRESPLPDNNYFLSYMRYRAELGELKQELREEYGGDLKQMVLAYVNKYGS